MHLEWPATVAHRIDQVIAEHPDNIAIKDGFGRVGNIEHAANSLYWGMDNTINIPDVYVYRNEYFGVRAKTPRALRCNSGSPNVLEFDPPLANGGSYRDPDDTNGCDPLIELEYRP